jgi:hypothetical protein
MTAKPNHQDDDPLIEKKSYQLPSAGPHQAVISDFKNMGQHEFGGEKKTRYAYELTLDERNTKTGEPLTQLVFFSPSVELKSKLLSILTQLGIEPGEHFRPRSLLGTQCGVLITLTKKDDGTTRSEAGSFYPLATTKPLPVFPDANEVIVERKPQPEDPTTITDRDVPF